MSEALAWELAKELGIGLTTLRPVAVYGARDHNLMLPIHRLLKLRLLILPSISFPLVYAGDVADAVAGALGRDASIGQAYNVGGNSHQFATFVKTVAATHRSKTRVLALPLPMGLRVNNTKAEREIGFRNRPLQEALADIYREDTSHAALFAQT